MSSLLRCTTALLIVGSLVAGCGGGAATVSPSVTATAPATATAAPTLAPTPVPTPVPTALPNGWAMVVMTGPIGLAVVNQGTTDVKTGLITGISVTLTITTLSDPRANGTMNVAETAQTDSTGQIGYLWATVTLENPGGSWAGTCRGIAWDEGNTSTMNCWLTGRGGYAGLTYTSVSTNTGRDVTEWRGLIYRGAPPAP